MGRGKEACGRNLEVDIQQSGYSEGSCGLQTTQTSHTLRSLSTLWGYLATIVLADWLNARNRVPQACGRKRRYGITSATTGPDMPLNDS